MAKRNKIAQAPPLRARLKSALALEEKTLRSWALEHGWHDAQLSMALAGTRSYPHIRDAIAELLRLPRSEVDRLLDDATESEPAA
jgi:lambda repressor-like predicted transcriptional regulator